MNHGIMEVASQGKFLDFVNSSFENPEFIS